MTRKSLLLCLVSVACGAFSASAQTGASGATFRLTPSTQNVSANSTFTVTLSLTGGSPPSQIGGFDLWLVTAAANSGLFTINSIDYSVGPFTSGSAILPDSFSTTATNTAFVRTNSDLGAIGQSSSDVLNPPYDTTLETLTIATGALTPGQTYSFFTSTQATAGSSYSDLQNADGTENYTVPQASFDIAVAGVPEPMAWAWVPVGVFAVAGARRWRRRAACRGFAPGVPIS